MASLIDFLIPRVRAAESGGNPDAMSRAGAVGEFQFMPATARGLGIDPRDPLESEAGARQYLGLLLSQFGDVPTALRAYNWGMGNVAAHQRTGAGVRGQPMPAEAREYPQRVMSATPVASGGRPIDDAAAAPAGRDLSEELFGKGSEPSGGGRDLSEELGLTGKAERPSVSQLAGGAKGLAGAGLRGAADFFLGGWQLGARALEGAMPAGSALEAGARRLRRGLEGWDRSAEEDYVQHYRGGAAPEIDVARIAGNVIPGLIGGGAGAARTLGGAILRGSASGAGFGALQPVRAAPGADPEVSPEDYWTEKAKQTGIGLGAGGAGALVGRGVASALAPRTRAPAKELLDAGVELTPGQVVGGLTRNLEEKAKSLPFVGHAIARAEQHGIETFNTATLNKALAPLGKQLPEGLRGYAAVRYVRKAIGNAYDDVLARVKTPAVDDELLTNLASLEDLLRNLPKESAGRYLRIIDNELLGRVDQGRLTSEAIKRADSALGREYRRMMSNPDGDIRLVGDAVHEAQAALRRWLERVAPPDVSRDVRAANAGWAVFKRVQRAAAGVATDGGVFTPAQLSGAVKAMGSLSQNAEGRALLQPWARAGREVMMNKVPDSGTAGRLLATVGLAGGVSQMEDPSQLGWLLAGALPYTSVGRRAAVAALTRRPQSVAALGNALRDYPMISPALAALLAQPLAD